MREIDRRHVYNRWKEGENESNIKRREIVETESYMR